jgi:hypothetical protein
VATVLPCAVLAVLNDDGGGDDDDDDEVEAHHSSSSRDKTTGLVHHQEATEKEVSNVSNKHHLPTILLHFLALA